MDDGRVLFVMNILSWMIELWMKHHLVSDSNCNTYKPITLLNFYKDNIWLTLEVGLTFSVGDSIPRFTISIEQDMRIGDTKYDI